jgi:hypothetical protein
MKLRWPPLWRFLLPAAAFLALAVFALVTDEAFGYRRLVRMGGTGWRRIPRCASPFDYGANVVLCIETVCGNAAAREELNKLVQDLGIRIGLTFREGRRNNRSVRVLQGGIVAFGNRPLPCTLRNSSGRPLAGGLPEQADDEHRDEHGGDQHHRHQEHPGEADRSAAGSRKAPSSRKGGSTGSRHTSRGCGAGAIGLSA